MATLEELRDALTETLERRGTLPKLRGEVRAEVFKALDDRDGLPKPELPPETLMLNELVREYLAFQNYRSTLSVFVPESGQPSLPAFDRAFLSRELGVADDDSRELPLLYSVLARGRQEQQQRR